MSGARAGVKTRDLPIRLGIDCHPFYIPRCANRRCRAPLADADGNPRWDVLEGRFVCLDTCRTTRKADRP